MFLATRVVGKDGEEWVVDKEGKVSPGSGNGGNTPGGTAQPDQREELITEILQYLEQTITALNLLRVSRRGL